MCVALPLHIDMRIILAYCKNMHYIRTCNLRRNETQEKLRFSKTLRNWKYGAFSEKMKPLQRGYTAPTDETIKTILPAQLRPLTRERIFQMNQKTATNFTSHSACVSSEMNLCRVSRGA